MPLRSSTARRGTVRASVALATLAAAVACSDSSTAPSTTSERSFTPLTGPLAQESPNDPSIIRHVLPSHAAAPRGALYTGTVTTGTIVYHTGGSVLQSATNLVSVYWANGTIYNGGPAAGTTGTGTADGSLIGFFLRHLGGSRYFNINTTYHDASNRAITNAVNYNGFWANNANVPVDGANVTDSAMIAMLQTGFSTGKITYDPNTLYLIFSAGKVNLGGGFGSQYCAYHTHGTVTINGSSKTVLYAAMPYNGSSSSCAAQAQGPNYSFDPGVDPELSVLAHETEETTTDMMGNAWYDRRGYENGDKCAWTWGTTSTAPNGAAYNLTWTDPNDPHTPGTWNFLIQRNWIATNSTCSMSY